MFYLYSFWDSIAIVIMIFVNHGGGSYWFFKHARWNGENILLSVVRAEFHGAAYVEGKFKLKHPYNMGCRDQIYFICFFRIVKPLKSFIFSHIVVLSFSFAIFRVNCCRSCVSLVSVVVVFHSLYTKAIAYSTFYFFYFL